MQWGSDEHFVVVYVASSTLFQGKGDIAFSYRVGCFAE